LSEQSRQVYIVVNSVHPSKDLHHGAPELHASMDCTPGAYVVAENGTHSLAIAVENGDEALAVFAWPRHVLISQLAVWWQSAGVLIPSPITSE